MTTFKTEWNWSAIDRASFLRLLANYGLWCEQHAGPDSRYASLWTLLELHRMQFGKIVVRGVSTAANGAHQVDEVLATLCAGVVAPPDVSLGRLSWLEFALNPFPDLFAAPPGGVSAKIKDALLKRPFTGDQAGIAYDYLTRTDHDIVGGMLGLCKLRRTDQYDRARCDRLATTPVDSRHRMQHGLARSAGCDAQSCVGTRVLPRAVWRDRRGSGSRRCVRRQPHQSSRRRLRRSNVEYVGRAMARIVQGTNYPRLQRTKVRWDPRNVFRHALSIQSASRSPE